MKRIIAILLLGFPLLVAGQELSVAKFYLDEHDLTALNEATKVIDDNNETCALIKVETTEKGFAFDGGTVGIAKIDDNHPSEIWVYVPAGLRRISIMHSKLGMLRNYEFPIILQSARTYVMKLICGTVATVVQQKKTSEFLILNFTPVDAMVEIDGTIVETDEGTYSNVLPFGKHNYRISANNYHTEVGAVEIGEEKQTLNIDLLPAFGWIEVTGPTGASIFIDGKKVGVAPKKSEGIASGSHDVRIVRDKYLPHREQVLVNDNTVTTINPSLVPNFVTINLKTAIDAEIWINGEKKGIGSITEDLVPGEYTFETKKASHRSQSIIRNITMASDGTIELPAPVAITGLLMVNVKPVGAKILMDGKHIGESPMMIENVLVGSHDIVVSKSGYSNLNERVEISEGKTSEVVGKLTESHQKEESPAVREETTISEVKPVEDFGKHTEGMLDFNSNFTPTHWGVGADIILGSRLKRYYHIGGGLGVHSLMNLNNKDYNVLATLYLNNTFFIPTSSRAYPMIDFAIGGDLGVLGINQDYMALTIGLYGKAGFGVEYNHLRISLGYEYLTTHTGYAKIGIKF